MPNKEALRDRLKATPPLDDESRVAASAAMWSALAATPLWEGARILLIYDAMADEPDSAPIIERAWTESKRVFLPVMTNECVMRFGEIFSLSDPVARLGRPFREPSPDGPLFERIAGPQGVLFVAPALAVNPRGYRLGRGGGCYDRRLTYADSRLFATVAVCYRSRLVDFAEEDHDRPFDYILSETGLTRAIGLP